MKVEKMDKAMARTIGESAVERLKPLAEELGLEVKLGRGKFDPTVGTFDMKVEFSLDGAAKREFALQAPAFGLTEDHYQTSFTWRGKQYRLDGFNMRAPKRPILATELKTGKSYKMPESAIAELAGELAPVLPIRPGV